jgi:glycine dehydrogenase subunit 1
MSHYIPNTQEDTRQMLEALGLGSAEELFSDIPADLMLKRELKLPKRMSELELAAHMKKLAGKNVDTGEYVCFLGAGAYDHFIPSVVRHIISRAEFYTAYTPYQPEISQGMLQAIFEYQTMICQLTGMDVSNASMYDGATAVAEAALMAVRSTGRSTVAVSEGLHPEYREVLKTYARFNGMNLHEIALSNGISDLSGFRPESARGGHDQAGNAEVGRTETGFVQAGTALTGHTETQRIQTEPASTGRPLPEDCAAVILQSPNFFGAIEDLTGAAKLAADIGALSIACVDPVSLALLKPPGEYGIDIAVGDGQSLGNPLNYGGPSFGFMAVKKELVRKMPGRIVGETTDQEGRKGFVLTLQAREQHIRREKAVSNICSNQALNALAAAVYLSVMGRQGLKETADLCLQKAHYACEQLVLTGKFERANEAPFFKEFTVRSLKEDVDRINRRLLENNILGGLELERYYSGMKNCWLVAVTEKRTKEEIDAFVRIAAGC